MSATSTVGGTAGTWADTAPDAERLLVLAVTVMLVVGVLV